MSLQRKPEKHGFSGTWQERKERQEKQTLAGNTEGSRDDSSGKLTVFCILFALTDMYMMYFSLSITLPLGLEKDSELIFLGLEHMETMLQRIITHL